MARNEHLIAIWLGLGLCLTLTPAHAQKTIVPQAQSDTVALADVVALAKPYPNLRQEIRLARIAGGDANSASTCSGRRLGPEWKVLAGRVVGPYRCRIGARMLDITTSITFFDGAKHKIAAEAPTVTVKAKTLTESRLVWRWL